MKENSLKTYAEPQSKHGVRPLGESLPLDTPQLLMVDPSNICNFKCVFCPTGDDELLKQVGRPKGMMQLDLFHKIINDLAAFPKRIKVLHLYKDGEPLVNKFLEKMIAYAKNSDQVNRVEITTNGLLLTQKRSINLIDAGLDGIRISIYALNDAEYRNITRTRITFEKIRENVSFLYSQKLTKRPSLHIHCKIVDVNLSDDEKELFISTFSPISDSVHIDTIMGWSNSRDRDFLLGLTPQRGMSGEPRTSERIACSEPFAKLTINYDGSVCACCVEVDPGFETVA